MANTRRLVLAKASHPLTNRRGRLVPPRRHPPHGLSFHKRVDPPVPFKHLNTLAFGSKRLRRWKWRTADWHTRHPPSVRAQNSAPTAVGCRGAIRKMVRHPYRRARRAALINAVSPHQFPP
ncbi:MAG: hypothetical protein WCO77_00155, partial [bacterium]